MKEIEAKTSYKNYTVVAIDDAASFDHVVKSSDSEYVVYVQERLSVADTDWLQDMLGDAARPDIGFVQASHKHPADLKKNIQSLLEPDNASLINHMTRRNVAKHLYATARYNLPRVSGGAVMVETKKLKEIKIGGRAKGVAECSKKLSSKGYRNLYNPYVRVVK